MAVEQKLAATTYLDVGGTELPPVAAVVGVIAGVKLIHLAVPIPECGILGPVIVIVARVDLLAALATADDTDLEP